MKLSALIAIVLVLCICNVSEDARVTQPYIDEDAYQVYSVLLPNETSYSFAKRTLVIQLETVPLCHKKKFEECPSDLAPLPPKACFTEEAARTFKDAIADFARANDKRMVLVPNFESEKPYELVSENVFKPLFKNRGDWTEFDRRYPESGGYIIFSAVAFNKDKTQALIYSGSGCGGTCGHWGLHLLKKVDGKWSDAGGVGCLIVS